MQTSVFITLEGGHGVGKSTLLQLMTKWWITQGLASPTNASDRSTEFGNHTRGVHLLKCDRLDPLAETCVVASMRFELMAQVIVPAWRSRRPVFCERYSDAVVAFGKARGVDSTFLLKLNELLTTPTKPTLTVLLDLDPELALSRIHPSARHRVEREPLAFHHALRAAYRAVAEAEPSRFRILDASKPPEELLGQLVPDFQAIITHTTSC